ncbi:MAG: TrkH family potassium uptake protein [Actinobacteria bacterium]|nr:TrkH family potassium uptake protein [Actinomycetota bacterium]
MTSSVFPRIPGYSRRRRGMARRLASLLGAVVVSVGVLMLPAAATAALYGEWHDARALLAAAAVTAVVGAVGWRLAGERGEMTTKEAFAAAGLTYFVIALFGALPYLLTGAISDPSDALFETVAGFTTTGSTVVGDPGALSHGVLLWRAMTQWLGGMGIIVLSVAILPWLGAGGVQLARAEAPGPEPSRLTPRFRETAKRLWLLYVALTVVAIAFLAAGDMSPFEAVFHGLTTAASGGFSTEPGSMGAFSAYTQWVVIVVMFLTGISFALHFRALRDPGAYLRSTEFRTYAAIVLVGAVIVVAGLWSAGAGVAGTVRDGVFAAVALVTTTGFVTQDWARWVEWLQILVVGMMFFGAMAGSTSGGVKTFRFGILLRSSGADLRRLLYPDAVLSPRYGGRALPPGLVDSVQSFFLFYMMAFVAGTFLLALAEAVFGAGTDLVTSASAVASALGNIGPALGDLGPAGTYAAVTAPGKWLLSFLMILGRLEVFPVLLLFTRHLWRR